MKIPRRRSCPRISKARRRETRPQIEPLELRTVLASLYLIGTGVSVVAEGQAFTSTDLMDFGDRVTTSKPSDFTVVIDWGDGTPKDFGTVIRGSAGGYEAHGGHTYQQEGSYDVEVGVGRNSNGSDFVLGNPGVVVNNGALAAATPVVVKATQGKVSANVLVAGFADSGLPDPVGRVPSSTIQGVFQAALTGKALPSLDQVFPGLLGQYTATIDWGDGTAPTPGTVQLAGSNFSVSGTHAYARPGSFAINATVADRGVDQVYLPTQGHFLASADFNGDGRPDLAYSLVKRLNSGDELDLITLINQPDGSYLPASGSPARLTYPYFPFSGGEDWIEARAADLDLDGRQDLVVTDRSDVAGNTTFASYNQGGGNFDYNHTNIVNVFTGTVADVAIARVDGDAYPDIVLATKDQASFTPKGSLLTYRNLGTSHGFSSLGSAINVAYYPDQVRVADFNGDGRADLAVSGTKNVGGTFVGVFETRLGLSSSGFGSPSSVIPAIGGNTIISAMADLNGDGLKDFAVYGDNGKISLILGTGPGTFARATGSPVDFSSFTSQLSSTTSVNNLDLASIGQALDVALPAIRAVLDPTGQTHQTDLDAALLLQELNFTSYFNFKIDGVGDFNQDGLVDFIGHPTRYNFVDPANSSASFFTPLTNYLIRGTAAKTTLRATARVAPRATDDFDGDGRSDLTVYLPAAGAFGIRPSNGGPDRIVPFGTPGAGKSIPVPGDVDGDGKDDLTVYLPDLGAFATRPSTGGPDRIVPFGPAGLGQSIPAPGDYFGTGQANLAVYLPAAGSFAIRTPDGRSGVVIPFGSTGAGLSIPAPGDYDGDGKTDLAVYLPALGGLAYRASGGGGDRFIPFGTPGFGQAIPMPGDYDGDGKTDVAVYLPAIGYSAYRPSGGGADVVQPFGAPGARQTLPAPGDYAGIGRDQVAAYIPAFGAFLIRTPGRADVAVPFGGAGPGNTLPVTKVVGQSSVGNLSGFSAASVSIPIPDEILAIHSDLKPKKK